MDSNKIGLFIKNCNKVKKLRLHTFFSVLFIKFYISLSFTHKKPGHRWAGEAKEPERKVKQKRIYPSLFYNLDFIFAC